MASTLQDISDQLAAAVEAAGNSTVRVDARRGRSGSGIIWAQGVVLTASHVVERDEQITVSGGDRDHPATLAGRDPGTDLAVLRVEGLTAPAAARATSTPATGSLVLAVGRTPELQASLGIVASRGGRQRGWRGPGLDNLIVTDAALYEGFSGGPLVDATGQVVGVNSWYYGRGSTMALAVDAADRVAQSLLAEGRVKQPYLGIGTQPVYLPDALREQLGQDSGLMVISVETGSPAAAAGVIQGDTLVGVDGTGVARMRDLFSVIRSVEVGSSHSLKLVRAGEVKEVSVTVGERAD